MVQHYIKAKDILKSVISNNNPQYPLLLTSLYGLLRKYPEEEDLLQNLFQELIFYIEPGEINEIIKRNNIALEIEEDENSIYTTFGGSNQGNKIYLDQGEILYQKERPFVICTTDISKEQLLNTLCHELNHLVKGAKNGFYIEKQKEKANFCLRTGLAHYFYELDKNSIEMEYYVEFGALDEAINVIQTTEIMEEILSLKEWIEDEDIKSYLDSLNPEELKTDIGYQGITPLVRKFWSIDEFKKLIEKYILDDDIEMIIERFDDYTYPGAFFEMSDLIEKIYELTEIETPDKHVQKYRNKLNNIVQKFLSQKKKTLSKEVLQKE